MRGGEKVLAVLAGMFPQAPIYTLLARPEQLDPILVRDRIRSSWLQRFSSVPDFQRYALPVLARAARSLDATEHDAVICSDAATIKAIRTRPDALKVCYCHSPMRYIWDQYDEYYASTGLLGRLGLRLFATWLRRADRAAAEGVTVFVANSHHVANRISRSYGRGCVVIPPPVEADFPPNNEPSEDFYLVVGEHVGYKRTDLAIEACNRLRRPLVVIGAGPLLRQMRKLAGPTVQVIGWQPDDVVRDHLRRCRALLFCGQEDFGLVPVEAQAAGRPVIAYGAGGAEETVADGRSGVFFHEQTGVAVAEAIERFEAEGVAWSPGRIQTHTRQFSVERFRRRFGRFFQWCLSRYKQGGADAVRDAMQGVSQAAFL
jgi:glycosyltransferase involved in cell wall biosynthesis